MVAKVISELKSVSRLSRFFQIFPETEPWWSDFLISTPDPTFSVSGPSVERYPERQCTTGLLYITVSQDTRPSMAHWRL